MSTFGYVRSLGSDLKRRTSRWVLAHRVRARHETLICDPTAIWDYPFGDIDCIHIGKGVSVAPFAEIIVRRRSPYSSVEGKLVLGDRAVIGTGSNLRAAGGEIHIGAGSALGQNVVAVAANHAIIPGQQRIHTPWDETRCHVFIGANVWIGAAVVLLPGTSIGDNSVIGAGSVVGGDVPQGELWAGVPARKIRKLEGSEERSFKP